MKHTFNCFLRDWYVSQEKKKMRQKSDIYSFANYFITFWLNKEIWIIYKIMLTGFMLLCLCLLYHWKIQASSSTYKQIKYVL